MKKFLLLGFMLTLAFSFSESLAQERTVSGKVTSAEDGSGLPGVNVVLQGTTSGTVTDIDGNYSVSVPAEGGTLVFSFIGLTTETVDIGSRSVINVKMTPDVTQLSEVVVTALGIEREERSLGYSVQEVAGDEVSKAKEASFISALSGKVSGLSIKKSNSLGGSINAVIRGSNSLTGNNQALFVVDGIPISNSNLNTSTQKMGGGGYDYGNAASDIDPASIASISVLKGATAAALYGSDAANGVILITTKKGKDTEGLGVTVNHSTTFSQVDRSTFPRYQRQYGAGYGPYYGKSGGFLDIDMDGDGVDDYVPPTGEDASFGAKFNPELKAYQWDAMYPELGTYLEPSSWVAGENGPASIFQTGVANVTSVSLQGGNDFGSFRMGYSHDDRSGILPNSQITKDAVDLHASYNLSDRFKVDGKISYIRTEGKGRYGTGYDDGNVVQMLRQWFQMNVDLEAQKNAYFQTRKNMTWNPTGPSIDSDGNLVIDPSPYFWDNPYWVLYENYETDNRNRFFGKFQATYELADWVNVMARFGVDSYSDLREERIAIGSLAQSEYMKFQRTYEEYNNDLIFNFDKHITDRISFNGLLGMSIKDRKIISSRASTNGGLVVEGLYSLSNSVSALNPPTESDIHVRKYGYYGQASFGYNDIVYLDGTLRMDKSSTLPEGNNTYFYPSVSGSFIFSELLDNSWLSLGKVRMGYARVSGDAPSYSVQNTYSAASPFNSTPLYYIDDTSNNPDLRPETTDEIEIGIEAGLFDNRLGFDLSVYQTNTIDQILPVQVSTSTGFNYKYVNAGEMENKGIELSLFGTPIQTTDFKWQVNLNWARNVNKVVSLFEDGENLLIYDAWATAVNARVGEPYGSITGTNFVYHENGQRIVGSDGKYLSTESTTEVIGNIQPDWIGGINNSFSYKNLSLSFLIDAQKGGDILTYDMAFGLATGLYEETAGLNELGNPKRAPVIEGGGILLDGVTADGSVNTTRAEAGNYANPLGFYGGSEETHGTMPDAAFVYDASYVKLRQVSLSYSLPKSLFASVPLNDISVGVFGNNLWIIHKNLPYADPEAGASSGNFRGIQNGSLPSTRSYGFNLKIQF